jgi:hypothetical protein
MLAQTKAKPINSGSVWVSKKKYREIIYLSKEQLCGNPLIAAGAVKISPIDHHI